MIFALISQKDKNAYLLNVLNMWEKKEGELKFMDTSL
jgi:hypothetical protein